MDINKISQQLNAAIEDFKSLNDRMTELEKKGEGTTDISQSIDKAVADITALNQKLEEARNAQAERQDELEEQLNRMAINGQAGTRDELRASATQFYAAVNNTPIHEAEPNVDEYKVYCKAFASMCRRGPDGIGSEMRAALSVGSDPDGGYWVPAEMDNRVVERLYRTSPMRQFAEVIQIGTDAYEFVNDSNDATLGGWVGETASRSDTATPQVGKQRIEAHEHFAQPKATQKVLDDAMFNVEGWLSNKIGSKFGRTENASFVTGNGVAKPKGFLDYTASTTDDASRTWGTLQYVVSGASGGFQKYSGTAADDWGPFADIIAKLHPEYLPGAVFGMSSTTLATVMKLRDTEGRPFWDRSLRDGFTFEVAGFPVAVMEDMPTIAADSYSIAFGNFRDGYLIVDRFGTRVLRDPYTDKPFIKFYSTRRTGGDVQNFDAIKLMKFGTS